MICRPPRINYSYIMLDLLVIVGAELTLLFSIAAMKIYRSRADILTGRYILGPVDQPTDAHAGALMERPQPAWPQQLAWPQRPVSGVCGSENAPIQEPRPLKERSGIGSPDPPTTERILALTTLAASLGLFDPDIPPKDTADPTGADDRLEPSSPITSDLEARTLSVASRSSSQGLIRLDMVGDVPVKLRA